MFYLITQLLLMLAIASLLSGAIGWLCRRFFTEQAHQDQIRDHKRAGRQHIAEIDDLRRELTDRNTQVAGLNSKLHYNKEAMDQAEAQRASLLRDIDELQGLEDQLRSVDDERARLDQHLAEAEAELAHASRSYTDNEAALQQAIAEREQQLTAALNASDTKEQQLLAASASKADKEQQLKAALASKADKEQQLKDAAKAQTAKEEQLRAAAIAAAEKEEKLRAAANVNKNLEDIIASLNDDIKAKTAEREKAAQQHAMLTADLGRIEHKQAQSEQAADAKINDLEKSLRGEKDSLATARQAIAAGEEKLKSLNALLAERTQERGKLEKQCTDQQQEIAALQREIAKAQKSAADAQVASQKTVAELERELDKQKSVAAHGDRQVASETQAKGQLQKELDRLHADLRAQKTQVESQGVAAAELLEKQKLATADSKSAAAAAEQQLAELKREHADLKTAADKRLNDLHSSETEAAKLAEKITAAQAKIADLENRVAQQGKNADAAEQQLRRELEQLTGTSNGQQAELRDAASKTLDLQNTLADYKSNDAELRAMIEKLQVMLKEERRLAGQSLLSRIKELEAMLEAERRKADELHTVAEVGDVSWSSKSTIRTAANASSVSSKKSGTK